MPWAMTSCIHFCNPPGTLPLPLPLLLPLPLPLPFLFPYAGMANRSAMEGESSKICGAGAVHHHKCIA